MQTNNVPRPHPAMLLPVTYTVDAYERLMMLVGALWEDAQQVDYEEIDGLPTFAIAKDAFTATVRYPAFEHDRDILWFAWTDAEHLRVITCPANANMDAFMMTFAKLAVAPRDHFLAAVDIVRSL